MQFDSRRPAPRLHMHLHRTALALLTLLAFAPFAGGDDAMPPMPEMTTYQFGMLRRGPAWTAKRTPATDSIQAGHMANIRRMANEGLLIAAGPCLDNGDLRGIFVFRADSIATLRAHVARDPAIQARRLTLELREWHAPVGLGALYAERAKAPDHRDSMVVRSLIFVKRGPKWTDEKSAEANRIQNEHVAGVLRMLASGQLASAPGNMYLAMNRPQTKSSNCHERRRPAICR